MPLVRSRHPSLPKCSLNTRANFCNNLHTNNKMSVHRPNTWIHKRQLQPTTANTTSTSLTTNSTRNSSWASPSNNFGPKPRNKPTTHKRFILSSTWQMRATILHFQVEFWTTGPGLCNSKKFKISCSRICPGYLNKERKPRPHLLPKKSSLKIFWKLFKTLLPQVVRARLFRLTPLHSSNNY